MALRKIMPIHHPVSRANTTTAPRTTLLRLLFILLATNVSVRALDASAT
jgi:hypothetical protein